MMRQGSSLVEALDELVGAALGRVHTAIPGRVLSFDRATQQAVVQPVIRFSRQDPDTGARLTYTPKPIPGVPCHFAGGSAGSLFFDLSAGDTGILVFAERSIDEWASVGGVDVEPRDPRRFDLNDAVFVPGVRPFNGAIGSTGRAAGAVVLLGADVRLGDAAAVALAKAAEVEARLNAIEAAFNGHTHIYVLPAIPAAPGPTAPPLPTVTPTTPGYTATTKVKGV